MKFMDTWRSGKDVIYGQLKKVVDYCKAKTFCRFESCRVHQVYDHDRTLYNRAFRSCCGEVGGYVPPSAKNNNSVVRFVTGVVTHY